MNDHHLVFLKLLETELDRVIVPAAGSDVSRRISALAAQQLKRILIDETVMPPLRAEAVTAYRALLPGLRAIINLPRAAKLEQALDGALQNWRPLEETLGDTMVALLAYGDTASHALAAKLVAIDVHIRNGKETAWVEQSRLPSSPQDDDKAAEQPVEHATEAPTEPGGLSIQQHGRLLNFLKQKFPNETMLQVTAVKPLTGGFSKQTLFVELAGNIDLPDQLVMRRDALYVTTGSSVSMEFPVIEKMYRAGVKVPQPFAVDESGTVLGTPFILLSRVVGRILGNFPVVAEPSREAALNLARQLARLHGVAVADLEPLLHGGVMSVRDRMLAEIEQHEAMWNSVVNHRAFAVQAAIDWLKRNIALADGPRSVVHRDIGVHNFLVQDNDIAAFLDWETAVVGTPAEDVAYTYYQVVQMADWNEYLAAYESASGIRFDKRQLDFYMLWGSVRVVVGICKMVDPVFSGERVNLPEYYLGDYFGQVLLQRIATKLGEVLA